MILHLMRHGLAVDRGTPGYENDGERPLTPRGRRRIRRVAQAFVRLELSFDAILSSPLIRARQTAELVAKEMEARRAPRLTQHLAPGGGTAKLLKLIHSLPGAPDSLLLVGHEPDLGQLASVLLTGGADLAVVFKKGGVACLELAEGRAGRRATLEWLMTSRQLELMA